MLKGMKSLTLG